jgi:hypothetical protein
MTNRGKKWSLEDDAMLLKLVNDYRDFNSQEDIDIKVPNYERITKELERTYLGIKLRVIDKILYKKFKDGEDINALALSFNIDKNYLKERFQINDIDTEKVGKRWSLEDDEYLKKSIEDGVSYIEISTKLKRKMNGIKLRVIDKILYKKYKDGEDINTLKSKYNITKSIDKLLYIFDKLDNNDNYKQNDRYNELKMRENQIKIDLVEVRNEIKSLKVI